MVENLAQQTANQIVDKIVSADPHKEEDAFVLLNNKLYTDVYKADPSPQAAEKFMNDVFQDIAIQYDAGKGVPMDLALVWASQQLGHELPAVGFNENDLKNIATSTDPTVTVLDKAMANALISEYPDLQRQVVTDAMDRDLAAHECTEDKQVLADYLKKGGDPGPDGFGGYLTRSANCNDTLSNEDRMRMAGVVREIPPVELQSRLKSLDASRPMDSPF